MKAFFYSLLGAIAGVIIIHLAYRFVHIPVIPCFAVYAAMYISSFGALKHPIPAVISVGGVSLYGMFCYSTNAYHSITHYPNYMTVWGIFSDAVTAFAFLTSAVLFIPPILRESRRLRDNKNYESI